MAFAHVAVYKGLEVLLMYSNISCMSYKKAFPQKSLVEEHFVVWKIMT